MATESAGAWRGPQPRVLSADEAVRLIEPGDRVDLHDVAMTPHELLDALVRQASELSGVAAVSSHYVGTEYGVIDLSSQPLRRRAEMLISIAHPDARPEPRAAAVRRHFSLPGI